MKRFRINIQSNMDTRLKHKSAMIISGPSMAGKTTFVKELIKHRVAMYDEPPRKVHWFTGTHFEDENFNIYDGMPQTFDMVQPHDMVVLDDLMNEAQNSKLVSNLFTRMVHHTPCTVICITQNMFQGGKEARTRSLNCQYMVLFKNPRDASQIGFLGRQMYPSNSRFLVDAFKDATGSDPHSYLFLDMHQDTPEELRVRSKILPCEKPSRVYWTSNLKYKH